MPTPALSSQQHKSRNTTTRFLITVNVIGSAGPIRLVVKEGELVKTIIATILKTYSHEGRLPMLGSDANEFLLYTAASEELRSSETVSSKGCRSFLMCKTNKTVVASTSRGADGVDKVLSRKRSGGKWKSWINKSFNFKIASH